jgi:bifunctional ADP-heptose synthase (sugar kinase/adenylyltransferase)
MTNATLPPPAFLSKLASRADAVQRVAALRTQGPVVFTNGVFDVLRLGKGPDRPLNNELDRAALMAALESVSLVTWFDEDTPRELITALRPDVLVKGGDYDMGKLAETQVVLSYGGRAQAIPFVDGYSTTALVKKIRQG